MQRTVTTTTKTPSESPQKSWLQRPRLKTPPAGLKAAKIDLGEPRLLNKAEVLKLTNVSYPTLWQMMVDKQFPRSRIVAGRSKWLSTEIQNWIDNLPLRRIKGDAAA
jgi:predicted DNA-binding transcriptional regulator AlpA